MENTLPRREARENAFLLAFSQTFGDIPLAEAIATAMFYAFFCLDFGNIH